MVLLNARLSATSARNWARVPATSRLLISLFSMIRTQTRDTYQTLLALGADPGKIAHGPNLKAAADPLPCDPAALADMRAVTADRPLWAASSTHPGEEEIVLAAHRAALAHCPDLLLLLIPRHPERGDAVEGLIRAGNLTLTRRAAGQSPDPSAQVYLADTVGETGLWYSLSPIVFLGGSLGDAGGHNPYEPARAEAAIIAGPKVANFTETYAEFDRAGAAIRIIGADDLATSVTDLLSNAERLDSLRETTLAFAQSQAAGLDDLIKALSALIKPV
jgi:3-deoxy-D-manno-octulosonic-acid transferase